MALTHHIPPELNNSPVFSQGVESTGGLLFVGGQNGVTGDGLMASGFEGQTVQAYRNLLAVLADAGCRQEDVLKLTIYIVGDQDVRDGLVAAQRVWGTHPTAITVLRVSGLARPEALIEVEAVAQVPAE
ncbi:2-iminobutanoate/2-iminopropanoate deaminase [Austwickia sp. TVS 96-490-7B]|uniref:RidA family protein n=1 Tax=Austwickia sp. TVS 96-490-7B TaxID=2830843 RepID=UPI001C5A4253|nr:RidA family protein [Austwickia sp. TVS 96-490-7B]MBW3086852.1 2-iminobutanoate/2-iminopropanoate deaminase [Austwickia sp. TVS 96-490-7B]